VPRVGTKTAASKRGETKRRGQKGHEKETSRHKGQHHFIFFFIPQWPSAPAGWPNPTITSIVGNVVCCRNRHLPFLSRQAGRQAQIIPALCPAHLRRRGTHRRRNKERAARRPLRTSWLLLQRTDYYQHSMNLLLIDEQKNRTVRFTLHQKSLLCPAGRSMRGLERRGGRPLQPLMGAPLRRRLRRLLQLHAHITITCW
jgi:hypothetical protein